MAPAMASRLTPGPLHRQAQRLLPGLSVSEASKEWRPALLASAPTAASDDSLYHGGIRNDGPHVFVRMVYPSIPFLPPWSGSSYR